VDNVVYAWRKFHRLDFSTFSRCKGSGVACWWRGKDTWSPLVKKECIIIASPFKFLLLMRILGGSHVFMGRKIVRKFFYSSRSLERLGQFVMALE
jgi:hypothetical protein